MNFKGTDLNLLVALEALLIEKSVTRAAERLHITQPAVSNALRRIREQFDDPILIRSSAGFELTPVGSTLIGPVQEFLSHAESLLGMGRGFNPATAEKTYRLIMSDYCADIMMPKIASILSQEAPKIKCEVDFLNNRALSRLWAGDVDFCITPADLRLLDPNFSSGFFCREVIFTDELVCLVSKENPDTQQGLTVETYKTSPHVCAKFGDGTVTVDEQVKQQHGLDTKIVVPCVGALPRVIEGTNFIATVPARMIPNLNGREKFAVFPCPLPMPLIEETLLWHPRTGGGPSQVWFYGVITRAAKEIPTLVMEDVLSKAN